MGVILAIRIAADGYLSKKSFKIAYTAIFYVTLQKNRKTDSYMNVVIKETDIIKAANEGMDEFVNLFSNAILDSIGGSLTAENMAELSADQITLLAYIWLRDEVMDGGFVQLIHNGYGPFIFDNPFARAMKQWGLRDFSKLLYSARKLYNENKEEIERECSDEEFMALFERFPDFDDFDDTFVENEEEWTSEIAHYIDGHIDEFAKIEQ